MGHISHGPTINPKLFRGHELFNTVVTLKEYEFQPVY